jgi:predicted AAA+ superfamily ATPase
LQVVNVLTSENREREIGGAEEAMNLFGLKEAVIITKNQEEKISKKGKKIEIIPAWKWLLK